MPGNLEASELLYRIGLPPEDEAFMPAEGKTPLTAAQVEILALVGRRGRAAQRRRSARSARRRASSRCSRPSSGSERRRRRAPQSRAAPPRIPSSSLTCSPRACSRGRYRRATHDSSSASNSPGTELDAAALAALTAAAPEIVDLNLADTALDDAGLAAIGALPAATHLRLARNELTDAGLTALAGAPQLTHLNLYGNAASPTQGIAALSAIATLREVYLWGTGVSIQGAAALRKARPGLVVDVGSLEAIAAAD